MLIKILIILLFAGTIQAQDSSTGTVTEPVLIEPTTTQIYINEVKDRIKDFSRTEKISELNKELAKNPNEEIGQPFLNQKVSLIEEIKRIKSGSNKCKTIIYPRYEVDKSTGMGMGEGGFALPGVLLLITAVIAIIMFVPFPWNIILIGLGTAWIARRAYLKKKRKK